MKFSKHIAILGMLASFTCVAQTIKSDGSPDVSPPKLERMPESLEVRYAIRAAPPHLRAGATTYVLDPSKGYLLNHRGTNGVSCIVVRSDWQWPDRPFRDDIAWPVCFDAEGSKTLLQDYIYTAELRARGMDAKEVHLEVTKKVGTKDYPNPARTGVAYMIAPVMRGWTARPEPVTMNMPHYMFYAPGVTDADIGGKPFSLYPFMLRMSPGRDDVIILLVGETEKAAILSDSKDLLADLCSYRSYLCTTAATRAQMPNN
ncbi:MAG TPA: hypothetical protein VJK29_16485 [Terriglobales bacterium]|nr:hypothetical protein [Terriglobales bacterium]